MNTAKISVLPKNSEPVRPPGAFTRMKELSSTTQGHLVLLEYMEEYPLLLNNLGMGAQITTFYRKTSNIDNNWKRIQVRVEIRQRRAGDEGAAEAGGRGGDLEGQGSAGG